jgi:hypothetical protein
MEIPTREVRPFSHEQSGKQTNSQSAFHIDLNDIANDRQVDVNSRRQE